VTVLPSPIPHPLDHCPFDAPPWAYEALEWVVGRDWPQANEVSTWDVADGWYALAEALAEPHDAAFAAAAQIMSGYAGAGISAGGFLDAWQRLSGDERAPLNALVEIAHGLGEQVEECGRDIEAAKLEAWIELGGFLTELLGMTITIALTLGAATPAAGGLTAATRIAVQQIFERLAEELGTRALKTTAGHAATGPGLAEPGITTAASPPGGPIGYAEQLRRVYEHNGREERLYHLSTLTEQTRSKIVEIGQRASLAFEVGSAQRGEDYRRQAAGLHAIIAEVQAWADLVRSGDLSPAAEPPEWARVEADVADSAPAGVRTGDRSGLTGSDGTPIDRTRRYNAYGGLRVPLAAHQSELEEAMPRADDGRVVRLADPRAGHWFDLANDGGPQADPTRGLNCLDSVLALFDTYLHGRVRVSAPRTFDGYAHGNPDRPVGGEWNGLERVQAATGAAFQNLCPFVGGAPADEAAAAVDAALQNLVNHLHNTGHGAYAFIITDLEGGGCHSWVGVNQHGTILFLDPQVGSIAENVPLYRHHGTPTNANVVSMDALVVDAQGGPAPLPFHGPGQWRWTTPTDGDEGG
jgi:hypothetical protein